MLKIFILIISLLVSVTCFGYEKKIDTVVVQKSEHKLSLFAHGQLITHYHVTFGANPKGHKQQEGDEKTPEGRYILDYKKENSAFYKAIHISYPNDNDKANANKLGVNAGGLIMIHGQKNGFGWLSWFSQWFNWTDGCIAVTNADMDDIWRLVNEGTPIIIQP